MTSWRLFGLSHCLSDTFETLFVQKLYDDCIEHRRLPVGTLQQVPTSRYKTHPNLIRNMYYELEHHLPSRVTLGNLIRNMYYELEHHLPSRATLGVGGGGGGVTLITLTTLK